MLFCENFAFNDTKSAFFEFLPGPTLILPDYYVYTLHHLKDCYLYCMEWSQSLSLGMQHTTIHSMKSELFSIIHP